MVPRYDTAIAFRVLEHRNERVAAFVFDISTALAHNPPSNVKGGFGAEACALGKLVTCRSH